MAVPPRLLILLALCALLLAGTGADAGRYGPGPAHAPQGTAPATVAARAHPILTPVAPARAGYPVITVRMPLLAGAARAGGVTFSRFTLKPNPTNNAQRPAIAVDAKGGTHVVYSAASSDGSGHRPAYYGYCPSACSQAARWTVIILGEVGIDGGYATLALDPAGRPRVAWYRGDTFGGKGAYQFTQCNAGCTISGNWSAPVSVTPPSSGSWPFDTHYFALDTTGRPRLVYHDTDVAANHAGVFYRYCDASCTAAANWRELRITTADWYDPFLVFGPGGLPRLAFTFNDSASGATWLAYIECHSHCTTVPENWQGMGLYVLGADRGFSLRLDGDGHPRLAVYIGYRSDPGPANDRLLYAWCDNNCGQYDSWGDAFVGLPANFGYDVDLALDGSGRPQVAYRADSVANSTYGLGYARCTADCQSGNATWQSAIVETPEELDSLIPMPEEKGCRSNWLYAGLGAALAVDGSGNPRIAHEADHYQGVTCRVHKDAQVVRLAVGDGGALPPVLRPRLFLPSVRR